MKKILIGLLVFFLLSLLLSDTSSAQQIKKPVVSGSFYPDSAKILAQTIKQFLDWADIPAPSDIAASEKEERDILALISPHAGYNYSGSVAAYAYKVIKGRPISTVVIIGPSHYEYFDGISVYPQGVWQTPLGNVTLDSELAKALIEQHPKLSFYEPAFTKEHSIEVQLPFLQIVLDNFQVVPIVTGRFSYENCRILSQALSKTIKDRKDVLVVVSTDLSHYRPYEEARRIDNLTIKELKKNDPQSLYDKLVSEQCQLCGSAALIAALLYVKERGGGEIEILKYANSGDIGPDKQRVVGYLSAAIYARSVKSEISQEAQAGRKEMVGEYVDMLNEKQQKRLLEVARQSLNEYVANGKRIEFSEDDPLLLKNMGAFVTLHKQGQLRGCIGNIVGRQPLYLTVRDMAIEAATADPRFPCVLPDELADIDIEVSVLTEPKKVQDIAQLQMGVHGVIVKKGNAGGVFLPQVAQETGWTREEFLSNLCAHKAGLTPDAWKDKDTELHSFSAQVFGEKD